MKPGDVTRNISIDTKGWVQEIDGSRKKTGSISIYALVNYIVHNNWDLIIP